MPERLPRPEADHEWLGAHFFFDGDLYSETCDRVVLEVVAPLIEELAGLSRRWFFLRYSEGGPHVRLRIYAPSARLAAEARPAIERAAATAAPLVRRLEYVAYEPEVERYGGPHGVVLAEELFHHSSAAALALLRKAGAGATSARLGKAVLAMLVLLHVFFERREVAAEIAETYGTGYLRAQVPDPRQQELWMEAFTLGFDRQADRLADYVEVAWEALATGGSLTADLDLYRDHMQEMTAALRALFDGERLLVDGELARRWLEVRRRIVVSYLHMMNNRLGVSIREECYLAVLIHQILDDVA